MKFARVIIATLWRAAHEIVDWHGGPSVSGRAHIFKAT